MEQLYGNQSKLKKAAFLFSHSVCRPIVAIFCSFLESRKSSFLKADTDLCIFVIRVKQIEQEVKRARAE